MSYALETVFQVVPPSASAVPCRLDGTLVPACNFPQCMGCKRTRRLTGAFSAGRAVTLGEVAEQLNLSAEQCSQQCELAVAGGWLSVEGQVRTQTGESVDGSPAAIRSSLHRALGEERATALLQKAQAMVGPGGSDSEWLIALELCSSGLERRALGDLLA